MVILLLLGNDTYLDYQCEVSISEQQFYYSHKLLHLFGNYQRCHSVTHLKKQNKKLSEMQKGPNWTSYLFSNFIEVVLHNGPNYHLLSWVHKHLKLMSQKIRTPSTIILVFVGPLYHHSLIQYIYSVVEQFIIDIHKVAELFSLNNL